VGSSSDRLSCHQRAVRILAGRAHVRAELAHKLTARGYEAAAIEEALDRCAAQGYLDEEATARAFVAEASARRGWGRSKLRAELARRGAAAAAIAAALAALGEEDDMARAREVVARWRRGANARGRVEALARHLDRKGFSRRVIVAVLADVADAQRLDAPDAEPAD